MASETSVDRFGRVVIPKRTRERFGLGPGTALTVSERDDGILLRPESPEVPLQVRGGVLVFTGDVSDPADEARALHRHREERLRRLLPRGRR
jgi:AbrB family looped-hinge helix DNA binding protein